jgi:hypothetical protein
MAESKVNASDAGLRYYDHDGCLFRQKAPEVMPEIYRGSGQWERWYDLYPVLYGSPLEAAAAAGRMEEEDAL